MSVIGRFLLSIWGAVFGLPWTAFVAGMYVVGAVFHVWVRWMDFCQVLHGRVLLALLAVRVVRRGLDNFAPTQTAIVMANHRSMLDIPLMAVTVPHIRFVAKKELGRIPIFGWALIRSEHVLIDRHDRQSAITALKRMAEVFGKGRNLMVFPEGTRARGTELLPFKKGGFHLAIDTGLPILPVSISGNERILPKGTLLMRPGTVTMTVHPMIPVEGKTAKDIPALMAQVRAAILSGLPESGGDGAPAGATGTGA